MWTLIQVCFVLANIENMSGAQWHFFSDVFGFLGTKIFYFYPLFFSFFTICLIC